MNVLILGGNSPRHEQWIRELADELKPLAGEILLHDYQHWQTGQPNADVEYEISEIAKLIEGFEDYVVIGKSIGTVITTLMISRGLLKPESCLLLGVPFGVARSLPEFVNSIYKLPKGTVIQNTADPLGSFDEVKNYFAQYHQINVVSNRNDTHDYTNFELIKAEFQKLL